jgi:hypothetical protein
MPFPGWSNNGLAKPAPTATPSPTESRFKDVWTPGQAQYEQAFLEGSVAHDGGIEMHAGPYELGSSYGTYCAWVDGWQHAAEGKEHKVKLS